MFSQWLGDFAKWFKKKINVNTPSHEQVLAAIGQYIEDLRLIGLSGRDFLRVPMFQFIYSKCATGDNRLRDFMRDLVISANQAAAA